METINVKATDDTPKVTLDAQNNVLLIAGRSLPENIEEFYQPIMDWLDEYSQEPNPETIFTFKMDYFNTLSHKAIFFLVMTLKKIHDAGRNVVVEWYFNEEDEDTREAGHELERVSKIPFTHVPYRD